MPRHCFKWVKQRSTTLRDTLQPARDYGAAGIERSYPIRSNRGPRCPATFLRRLPHHSDCGHLYAYSDKKVFVSSGQGDNVNECNVAAWAPPALPQLVLRERGENWLCLNPEVPAWFVTNRAGTLLLQLADGSRTIADIHHVLEGFGIKSKIEHVDSFFSAVRDSMLFSEGSEDNEGEWETRKLSAVHLHLTNRCNLECTYCFRESTPRLPVHLTAEHFVDALRRMLPFSADTMAVTFTGGEPMMFPGFERVVEASTELGYTNILLTNGILITPSRAAFIARHFSDITISLDGPSEDIHAATRGQGNYERVLRGIRRLADEGAKVSVKVTVSPANLPYCQQVSDVLPDSVPVQFTPLMPMGRGQQAHDDFIDNNAFVGLSRGLERVTDGRLSNLYVPGSRARRCHAGAFNVSIADTGDVYPCHLFHMEQFRLGNIFDQPFDEIFFGKKNRAYVETMDVEANNDICRACEVRFMCGGGCKANTLHSVGDYRGVDLYCGYLKTTIVDELFRSCGVEVESKGDPRASSGSTFLGMPEVIRGADVVGNSALSTSI